MTIVENKISKRFGTASTLEAGDFIQVYADGVAKFLEDNKLLGDDWVKDTAYKLYVLNRNKDGEVVGSNTYVGAFISTYLPEVPLIRGREIQDIITNTGSKTPFGSVYVDFGVQVNGNPKTNKAQAQALLADYKARNINNKDILVPDFNQLRLLPDKSAGLIFRLSEDVKQDDLTPLSAYKINSSYTGKDGLFRACLGGGSWCASDDVLSYSFDYGRVVRYDAEGVNRQKFQTTKKDSLTSKLTSEFLAKFK